jgi:hypothetical protein
VKATLIPAIKDFVYLPTAIFKNECQRALVGTIAAIAFNFYPFVRHGRHCRGYLPATLSLARRAGKAA